MKRESLVVLAVGLALTAACGGGSSAKAPASASDYSGNRPNADSDDAPPPAMAKTTATASAAPPPMAPNDGDPTTARPTNGQAPTPQTYSPGNAPPPPVAPQNGGAVDARRSWALATLGDSENQIQASLKECTTACKALASMERAAKTLCDLGAPDECSRAKARVDAAREKVKKSCGSCPNGPSVIPGAPIPTP